MHPIARRLRDATALMAGISALLALQPLAASASARAPGAGSIWSVQRSANRSSDFNELTAITTISASDAWAVGPFRGSAPAFKTLIEHFDGSAWHAVQSPNVGTSNNELNAVSADSSSDAWAAGFRVRGSADRTLTERWNGSQWSVVASPNVGSGSSDLRGVVTISPTDAWFHDIVAWESVAETAAESLSKGTAVTIDGRLQTRTWQAADGSQRRATEVIASGVAAA